jgi:hypothetical protein
MFGGRGLGEIQKYLKVLFIIFCRMQIDHSTGLQVDMTNQSDQIYNQIEARRERSNCDTNKRRKDSNRLTEPTFLQLCYSFIKITFCISSFLL